MKKRRIIVIVLALILVLSGCSKSGQTNNTAVNNANNVQNNAAPVNGNTSQNVNDAGNSGPGGANEATNTNDSNNNNNTDHTNNTDNTAESNTANNTNNSENTANTENNSENTANTENNAPDNGNNTNNTDDGDYAVMKELVGVWYDQYSYGELKIEKTGECTYTTYAGDFSGMVAETGTPSKEPMYFEFDMKLGSDYTEYPNLFYDKENDSLFYESGGQINLFTHDIHPYEPIDWVYAMWGDDMLQYYPDHIEYTEDTSENSRIVLFDTIREIKDLCFTTVSITHFDEKDQPVYQSELLYSLEKLEQGTGFAVRMSIPGDTPAYGILYTDPVSGEVRQYMITISGMDGSLQLVEY